jgi:excisionase family DNA binding protein
VPAASAPASPSPLPTRPDIMTLQQVAAWLQVSPRWLRDFVRRKPVPFLKAGRAMRFDKHALAALEDELRVLPPGPFKRPPYRNGTPLPKRGRERSGYIGLEKLRELETNALQQRKQ